MTYLSKWKRARRRARNRATMLSNGWPKVYRMDLDVLEQMEDAMTAGGIVEAYQ